jgi:hypothetical protein
LLRHGAIFHTAGPRGFDYAAKDAIRRGDEASLKWLLKGYGKDMGRIYDNLLVVANKLGYKGVADLLLDTSAVSREQDMEIVELTQKEWWTLKPS